MNEIARMAACQWAAINSEPGDDPKEYGKKVAQVYEACLAEISASETANVKRDLEEREARHQAALKDAWAEIRAERLKNVALAPNTPFAGAAADGYGLSRRPWWKFWG